MWRSQMTLEAKQVTCDILQIKSTSTPEVSIEMQKKKKAFNIMHIKKLAKAKHYFDFSQTYQNQIIN